MAEPPTGQVKRGRTKLCTAERKKIISKRKVAFNRSRVYLGGELSRWNDLKSRQSLLTGREVATLLIDRCVFSFYDACFINAKKTFNLFIAKWIDIF